MLHDDIATHTPCCALLAGTLSNDQDRLVQNILQVYAQFGAM